MDQHKPRIGISGARLKSEKAAAGTASVKAMAELVKQNGGEPVIIDHEKPPATESLDGIILMGNNYDIDPKEYRELANPHTANEMVAHLEDTPESLRLRHARARYEWSIVGEAERKRIPIFGVCGGMQRINVALGGKLIQHIEGLNQEKNGSGKHEAIKPIKIVPLSHLHNHALRTNVIDLDSKGINSLHHQAIDQENLGRGLRVSATSEHGTLTLVEAVEAKEPGWYISGVQWHPEFLRDDLSKAMIGRFIHHAQEYQQNKAKPDAKVSAAMMAGSLTASAAQTVGRS